MCKLITMFRQLEKLEVGIDKPNGRPISLISLLKVICFYHSNGQYVWAKNNNFHSIALVTFEKQKSIL